VEDGATSAASGNLASSAPSAAPVAPSAGAQAVIAAWNQAHNAHDADALAALYAPEVFFYGATLPGVDCARKKRAAFTATPDYAQSIRDAKFEPADAGATFVRLVKTGITKGASKAYPSILVIDASGKIAEEGDDLPEDWCIDTSGPPSVTPLLTDRVALPFRLSAQGAVQRARGSKHLRSLSRPVGDIVLTCARRCAVQTPECGYSLTLHDMDRHGDEPGLTVSSWMGQVYVEPVTRALWWEESGPDGGTVWRSESL